MDYVTILKKETQRAVKSFTNNSSLLTHILHAFDTQLISVLISGKYYQKVSKVDRLFRLKNSRTPLI